jgi:hypothetical protein
MRIPPPQLAEAPGSEPGEEQDVSKRHPRTDVMFERPGERGAHVAGVLAQPAEGLALPRDVLSCRDAQRKEPCRMSRAQLVPGATGLELLERVLPGRLHQKEPAAVGFTEQALVDKRLQLVELRLTDLLGGL